MDPALAFQIGVATVIVTFCWIAYVSVMSEALHGYAFSVLFDLIPENNQAQQRKFEALCRRDDEFLQVAELGRIIGFVAHFIGWVMIIWPPEGLPFEMYLVLVAGGLCIASLVVCVVIVPPLILRHRESAALLVLLPFFAWIALPFKPFTVISSSVRRIGARIEGTEAEDTPQETFEEELADSLEDAEREGVLGEAERAMIHNVVELGQTPASRAMIPRTEMVCVEVDEGINGALKAAVDGGHSRIPVYEGDRDHVIGVFYTRDLVQSWNDNTSRPASLRDMLRPVRFWPVSKPLDDLLTEMRADRLKIGILTDEHGGTAGIVTLEDILERIVGDIRDEHDNTDHASVAISPFAGDQAEANGDVDLDEVNRVLELELPTAPEYNSVAGLVLHELGRIASKGDEVTVAGMKLTVIDADAKRIKRVRISRNGAVPGSEVSG